MKTVKATMRWTLTVRSSISNVFNCPHVFHVFIHIGHSGEDSYVAFVSGLGIGSSTSSEVQTQLLAEFLSGEMGDEDDRVIASRISRLFILGNSLELSGSLGFVE